MEGYKTDEEQVEHLKKWWNENGKSVIAGIVVGLLAIFGWRGWQDHLVVEAKEASDLYEKMITETLQDKEADKDIAKQLKQNFKSTPYSTFSSLLMAREAIEKDNIDTAKKHLQWVIDNTHSDEFKHLARLRLSRLLLVQGEQNAALSLIEGVNTGRFSTSYYELHGDILLQQGDSKAAKNAYVQALATQNNQSIVQMKLDDLGANQL